MPGAAALPLCSAVVKRDVLTTIMKGTCSRRPCCVCLACRSSAAAVLPQRQLQITRRVPSRRKGFALQGVAEYTAAAVGRLCFCHAITNSLWRTAALWGPFCTLLLPQLCSRTRAEAAASTSYHAEGQPEQQEAEPCDDLKVQADANAVLIAQDSTAGSNWWCILKLVLLLAGNSLSKGRLHSSVKLLHHHHLATAPCCLCAALCAVLHCHC